jgi:hypothetical protein
MQLDDFLQRLRSQPERIVRGSGLRITPEALAKAHQPGGIRLSEILAKPAVAPPELHFRHVVAPPATEEAIAAWESKWPYQAVPAELLALVRAANGIHFWANAQTGDRYTGLAPIEEWEIAGTKMYGTGSANALLDGRYVAISYDVNGESFVVVDVLSGKYYSLETSGPDTSAPIADNLEELLGWLWKYRGLPPGTIEKDAPT